MDIITFVGMLLEGTLNGQMVGVIIGGLIIVVLDLKYGSSGWNLLDKSCLLGAGLGIGLWIFFDSPVFSIITSQSVIFLGSFPTFVSIWKDPSKENKIA